VVTLRSRQKPRAGIAWRFLQMDKLPAEAELMSEKAPQAPFPID
jgi:hypothetical protein